MPLPILDLAKTRSLQLDQLPADLQGLAPQQQQDLAQTVALLREAATTSGFFYIQNHGIAPEILARQFEIAQTFFELPRHLKMHYSHQYKAGFRGYEAFKGQQLDVEAEPDLKEGFYCGRNYAPDHPYVLAGYQGYSENRWPNAVVADFETDSLRYIEAMVQLSQHLMQLLALSLKLPANYFDQSCIDPMLTLRMIRYPSHPEGATEKTFGAGAHTDWGALTILAQDDLGGLEVCMPDGTWLDATPIKGTFVVNLGDMIPRWTNGLYHSNPHRVRNRFSQGQSRYSIPFFYEPDYLAEISAVPGTVADGEQAKYRPCTAGEHLQEMYQRSYGFLKKSGQTAQS